MSDLKNEIHDYWTNRARGYSEYNQQEMADARRTMWRDKLLSLLREAFPEREPGEIKILRPHRIDCGYNRFYENFTLRFMKFKFLQHIFHRLSDFKSNPPDFR